MENSNSYKLLINQVNAQGYQKCDGYYPNILSEIYEWERDEVEDIIWISFHKNKDMDLAYFFPKLRNYDGLKALKIAFQKYNHSIYLSSILYQHTGDEEYLSPINESLKNPNSTERLSAISTLENFQPTETIYEIFKSTYIYDDDNTVRNTSAEGMLICKGYIDYPYPLSNIKKVLEMLHPFQIDDISERKEIVKKFETGNIKL